MIASRNPGNPSHVTPVRLETFGTGFVRFVRVTDADGHAGWR